MSLLGTKTIKIVGIVGQSKTGKSTTARRFVEQHGFLEISFADELKRMLVQLTGADHIYFWGPSDYRTRPLPGWEPTTARDLLKRVGDAVVGCNEFALIKKVDAAVSWIEADKRHWYTPAQGMCTTGYLHNVHGIVIPDCRQISEMKWVRYLGGKLIRVHGRTDSTDTHRTEIEQLAMPDSEMDLVINNKDLTVEQLHARVDAFASSL